ncbi:OmpG family monomeric porin [Endozoicomonas ascidiicola]|uniref:OmpG family monomeric porin n=1 Tax=Endozoicomonas ascidiicola TaxID=1698521 RepID=UPI000836D5ED|nr:OmpG family monomeric porin [Endozoicomonas ascidiicola]
MLPIVRLGISNPNSDWSYSIEHKVSKINVDDGFTAVGDAKQRNRTQFGATKKIIKSDDVSFNLNATYRKESWDGDKGGYNLYWIMPSGSVKLTDKLSFSYWDAFYYYDRFDGSNDYEWEAEHGLVYTVNDSFSARVFLYNDWTWSNDKNKAFQQNQIRGYFPVKLDDTWSIMPYFRYYLSERSYDDAGELTDKNDSGLRVGTNVDYKLDADTTLWANSTDLSSLPLVSLESACL